MLYVVKMGWKEMADTSRIDEVLSHALKKYRISQSIA